MKTENKIVCKDVLEGLKELEDDSVDLIFTSPPYNCKIDYNNSEDNLSYDDYLKWIREISIECKRLLKTGGRYILNFDQIMSLKEERDKFYIRNMYSDFSDIMKDIGLLFKADIVWNKQNVCGSKTAFGSYMSPSCPNIRRNHEYILVWCKDNYVLKGDRENIDITKEEFHEWTMSSWNIMPETRKLCSHPAPFPEELARRIIKVFSYKDSLVLDPFSGIGTTCLMAKKLNRRYYGIDNSQKYVDFSIMRIKNSSQIFNKE